MHFVNCARIDEAKECFAELKRLGWPPYQNSQARTYATALEKFAPDSFEEVTVYIRSALLPNDAVESLSIMASRFDYFEKQPQMAAGS